MDTQAQRKAKVFSRREIEGQIANGRAVVIVDSKVLNVGAWMPYHPGGDKAMRHMIGRDATDEVTRYAAQSSSMLEAKMYSQVPLFPDSRAHESLSNRPHRRTLDEFPATNPGRKVQGT